MKSLAVSIAAVATLALAGGCAEIEEAAQEANAEAQAEAQKEESGGEPKAKAKPDKPKLTTSQEQAIKSAESYLRTSAFSKQGLIDQLSSEYGEGFPREDAAFAVKSLDVDWNEQAVKSAKSYLETSSFSRQGLIDQLSSEYGEKFTVKQATYAADKVYN